MKFRIKNNAVTLKTISWLQIIGGITGLGLIAYLMLNTGPINGPILLILLVGLTLFIYSIYCGKTLLKDENKKTGIIISIINQALQSFHWGFYGYNFVYSSGVELSIGIKGVELDFSLAVFTSRFSMSINSGDYFFIKVNVIAILVIYILVDLLNETKSSNMIVPEPEPSTVIIKE